MFMVNAVSVYIYNDIQTQIICLIYYICSLVSLVSRETEVESVELILTPLLIYGQTKRILV